MANSGPNTNGSQFFITFRSCSHLDGKHSVFGKITEGIELLDKFEKMEVGNKDVPKEDIIIEEVLVMENPYRDAIAEILMKEWLEKHDAKKKEQ